MKHSLPIALLLAGLTTQARAQAVTFATAASYGGGSQGTSSVVVQDLNGDNRPDLVVANTFATVGVLLNAGAGTFPATATTYASGATSGNSRVVALGDVNADGRADIVVLNANDSNVGVLLGQSGGTFQAVTTYAAGSFTYPTDLALADVNADGRADVLVATTSPSAVLVLVSRSTGGFNSPVQYSTGTQTISGLTTSDMNGDGKADIVFGSSGGSVGVLLNTGAGTFPASPAVYATGSARAGRPRVGDVNNDGRPDVVTASYSDNSVSVLLGQAGGALGTGTSYSAGSSTAPAAVTLGDLNKDGRLDIVAANYSYNSAGVLLGQAAGGFPATATQFSTGSNGAPTDVVVADLNADTKPDIIVANSTTARVAVLLNTTPLAASPALAAASVAPYPNPARGSFGVQVPGVAGAASVQAELRTALGQLVRQQAAPLPAAGTYLSIPTAGLAAGTYLLHLQAGDSRLVQRVVVE